MTPPRAREYEEGRRQKTGSAGLMGRISEERKYDNQIDLGVVARVLKSHGRSPVRCSQGIQFRCLCGGHKHDDRNPSATVWVDGRGRLGAKCWADAGDSKQLWTQIMRLIGGWDYTPTPTVKASAGKGDRTHQETQQQKARNAWRKAFPVSDRGDTPAQAWLGRKCWFYGPVPGGIRWDTTTEHRAMVGSIIALLAPPSAWREAYPGLPVPSAIQKIALDHQGHQVAALKTRGGRIEKRSTGPMLGSVVIFGMTEKRGTVRVAEGVADALAVHSHWLDETWAMCGTSGFSNVRLAEALAQYDEAIIHADAGDAGRKAAEALRDNVLAAGGYAIVCMPASGDDPADSHGNVADAAPPASEGTMEVKWDDNHFPTIEKIVGKSPWSDKNSGSDHRDGIDAMIGSGTKPERTYDLRCTEPYLMRSNLPDEQKFKGARDCGGCGGCIAWWRQVLLARLAIAGGVQSVLSINIRDPKIAVRWRQELGRHLKGAQMRTIHQGITTCTIRILNCYDVTDAELLSAKKLLGDAAVEYEWSPGILSREEAAALIPWRKSLCLDEKDEDEKGPNAVSTSRSMPQFEKGRTRPRYTYGDVEMVNQRVDLFDVSELPEPYKERESMANAGLADLKNASDRMSRDGFNFTRGEFLDVVQGIEDGDVHRADDLKKIIPLGTEYGGSRMLIFDCAKWVAGSGGIRIAYGPVLERFGLLTNHQLHALGVDPRPCRQCGSKYCECEG